MLYHAQAIIPLLLSHDGSLFAVFCSFRVGSKVRSAVKRLVEVVLVHAVGSKVSRAFGSAGVCGDLCFRWLS